MYRGRVFTVPLHFVAATERLAPAVDVFPGPGRSAVLYRSVSHAHRALAVCPPPSAIGGCGHFAFPWREGHTHVRVSGFLWDGWAGIRGFAVAAFQKSLCLGGVHRLGCRRMADHQRRSSVGGIFIGRAASVILISPAEAATGVGRIDTHGHSFGRGSGRAQLQRFVWTTGSQAAPRFQCIAGSSRLEAAKGTWEIAGHTRRRNHFAPRFAMVGRLERAGAREVKEINLLSPAGKRIEKRGRGRPATSAQTPSNGSAPLLPGRDSAYHDSQY